MGLRLSTADLTALEQASTVLLSPFAYENGELWRLAAARSVERCVGADASAFMVALPDEAFVAADPDVARALEAIVPFPDWVVRGMTVRRRELGLSVMGWEDAFDLDAVRRTPFYNEVARPERLLAPLSIMVDTGAVVPASIAMYFRDERAASTRAQRRKDILRLLVPALRAGLYSHISFSRHRAALTAVAEQAATGVLFFDAKGHLTGENEFFRRLMECEPERDRVRGEASYIIHETGVMPKLRYDPSPRRASREVRTGSARYRMSVTFLGELAAPPSVGAIVLVERCERRPIAARDLAGRFFLTRREIEAAELLRCGLSSRQIAASLGISVNTARRHVERILLKLDVHSRIAAAAKLAGD